MITSDGIRIRTLNTGNALWREKRAAATDPQKRDKTKTEDLIMQQICTVCPLYHVQKRAVAQ